MTREQFRESPVAESRIVEVYDDTDADPRFYRFESGGATLYDQPAVAAMTWNPADRTATLRFRGVLTNYYAADLAAQQADAIQYVVRMPDSDKSLTWNGSKSSATVLGAVFLKDNSCVASAPRRCTSVTRLALAGPVANAADVPVSGIVTYDGTAYCTETSYRAGGGTAGAGLIIDFSAGTVSSDWTIDGRAFELRGMFSPNANPRVTGTVRTADGEFAGRFVGNLYGSNEVGIIFTVASGNFGVSGILQGRRR